MVELCFVCSNPADEKCDRCEDLYICSNHKKYHTGEQYGGSTCFPYRVDQVPQVGRILTAARDIQPGEVVFQEQEMVVGPCRTKVPLCLGCNRVVDGSVVCSCSWPLCSLDCSELFRHSQEECAILSRDDPKTRTCDNYRGILPLRILLLPNTEMQYFLQFMDHGDDREDKFEELVELVRVRWGLHHFPAELVRQVEGILDVNTVEHRVEGGESARGFLPITSLASHSCASNSIKDKCVEGRVVTRAKVLIKKGEEITFHYTGGLKGRLMRRKALRAGWFFWCACPRCSSPSELGSELSSLLCVEVDGEGKGCGGVVRPVEPLQQDSQYRCNKCSVEISSEQAEQREKDLTARLEQCYSNDTVALQYLLNDSSTSFHDNHFLRLIIKWLLITSWGRSAGLQNEMLPRETIEQKVVLCKQYLAAIDILDPGLSHNRGLTLWELHSASTFLINKLFKEDKISAEKFLDGLKESLNTVVETIYCLQFNQEGTREFQIREVAITAEQNLRKAVEFFSTALSLNK